MRSSPKRPEYPDELTCDEIEIYKTFRVFDEVRRAKIYSIKISGEIYTQVDADGEIRYSRGVRYVNRTGIYAVVRS